MLPLIWLAGGLVSSPLGIFRRLLSTAESLTMTGYPFSAMVAMYTSFSKINSSDIEVVNLARLAERVEISNITGEYQAIGMTALGKVPPVSIHQLIISQVEFLLSEMRFPPGLIVSYAECNEMFPSVILEMVYTTTVTIIQFLFPLVIAALANASIYSMLKDRLKTFTSMEANDKRQSDILRMKRTCWLLICMVTVFLICWLPLSIFNLMMAEIRENTDDNTFFTMFASCHLVGMASACTNPILYGFLNENFKKEFKLMFKTVSTNAWARSETSIESTTVL